MRAAVLTAYGRPPEPAEREPAVPAPDQVRVRVTAAPIAPLDLLLATGTSYFGAPPLPYVPGVQGVGVRDDGTRVFFATSAGMRPVDGSLAEEAVVPLADTIPLTADVPDPLVAALGLSSVAAWLALTWRAQVRPGESVLVLGAGGAVGQVAVQAAVALGAAKVVAASRREPLRELALRRGATAAVDLSDVDRVPDRLREAGPFDVVIDPVGGDTATAALLALGEHGRLVHLGASGGPTATFSSAALRSGSHSILGYTNNAISGEQRAEALGAVLDLAAAGRCDVTHETVPLADVADAWTRAGAAPDARQVVLP